MLGALLNAAAVIVGGGAGLLLKKGIPARISDGVMQGLALVVMYMGIDGMLEGENALITILSVVIGGALGALLRLDGRVEAMGTRISQKVAKGDEGFASAFVTTSLLYCVGAMAVVGALESGLSGDHSTLITKAVLDGVASVVFASTMGAGVLLAALPLLLFEGGIALLAQFVAPFLSAHAIAEITCMGSVLLLGMGLNMLKLTRIKTVDYLPSILVAALLAQFM